MHYTHMYTRHTYVRTYVCRHTTCSQYAHSLHIHICVRKSQACIRTYIRLHTHYVITSMHTHSTVHTRHSTALHKLTIHVCTQDEPMLSVTLNPKQDSHQVGPGDWYERHCTPVEIPLRRACENVMHVEPSASHTIPLPLTTPDKDLKLHNPDSVLHNTRLPLRNLSSLLHNTGHFMQFEQSTLYNVHYTQCLRPYIINGLHT